MSAIYCLSRPVCCVFCVFSFIGRGNANIEETKRSFNPEHLAYFNVNIACLFVSMICCTTVSGLHLGELLI